MFIFLIDSKNRSLIRSKICSVKAFLIRSTKIM